MYSYSNTGTEKVFDQSLNQNCNSQIIHISLISLRPLSVRTASDLTKKLGNSIERKIVDNETTSTQRVPTHKCSDAGLHKAKRDSIHKLPYG